MKALIALAVLAPSLVISCAWAAQPITLRVKTAGDLAELCGANPKEPAADAKINYCHGFAQGVVDLELQHAGDKKPFCFPSPSPSRERHHWPNSSTGYERCPSIADCRRPRGCSNFWPSDIPASEPAKCRIL